MRFIAVIVFVLAFVTSDAQRGRMFMSTTQGSGTPIVYEAISGETTFNMSAIPGENLSVDLYISYAVPAQGNCPLLVYLHGWDGDGRIVGTFHPDAIADLNALGIAIIGVGMRGRNTDENYENNSTHVSEYRDASAVELMDIKNSIEYFIENVAATGQINTNRIFGYGVSGGGGNMLGMAAKFPDYLSLIVDFYGISKYGTYTGDPRNDVTSWYTDQAGFQGQIQQAVSGAPLGSGVIDAAYLSRDHTRSVSNYQGMLYMYHDSGDGTVKKIMSDLVDSTLTASGKTEGIDYHYYESNDGLYAHGHHALYVDYYDGEFAMEWLSDALTRNKPTMPATGSLFVSGYCVTDDFNIWIKRYRKNVPATPRATAVTTNQGKFFALNLDYDNDNEEYEISPVMPSTSDQFFFVELNKGTKSVTALVSASDVVTLKPRSVVKYPMDMEYDWKVYYDFGDATDGYLLDDQSKVSNVFDLTGNNNFAFQQTRATRANISSGSLDNGVMYLAGTSGTLSQNVDLLQFTGPFTIVFSVDPDASSVGSLTGGVLGRGAGSQSAVTLGNSSSKIQINVGDQSGGFIGNSTPNNTDLGKQAWYIRRDASNNVHVKCVNGTNTYDYGNIGSLTGAFQFRVLGSAASANKSFSGKIYKVAIANEDIGDTDATAIINNWYSN